MTTAKKVVFVPKRTRSAKKVA
ncbi:UNVERIFIED_CONTAM: hypothetical protein GTU68_039931 [Idotea baltica]|nr:hypothetical protein [Idotea baltica]